jgi:hypothetical protein
MTHVPDLAPFDLLGLGGSTLLAVGWLAAGFEYPHGRVTPEVFAKLAELAVDPWQPAAAAGRHSCDLCVFTGGPARLDLGALQITVGSSNLFIPTPTVVYVAPSLILHYMDAHAYAPPDEFLRAVTACPPMRSMHYLRLIAKYGLNRTPRP